MFSQLEPNHLTGSKKKDIPPIKKYVLLLGFRPIVTLSFMQQLRVALVFDGLDMFTLTYKNLVLSLG